MLWLQVPDAALREVAEAVARWSETRICLSVLSHSTAGQLASGYPASWHPASG